MIGKTQRPEDINTERNTVSFLEQLRTYRLIWNDIAPADPKPGQYKQNPQISSMINEILRFVITTPMSLTNFQTKHSENREKW